MEESFCRLGIFIRPCLQYVCFFCFMGIYHLGVHLFLFCSICNQSINPVWITMFCLKLEWIINITSLTCKISHYFCVCGEEVHLNCLFFFACWLSADRNQWIKWSVSHDWIYSEHECEKWCVECVFGNLPCVLTVGSDLPRLSRIKSAFLRNLHTQTQVSLMCREFIQIRTMRGCLSNILLRPFNVCQTF